MAEELPEDGILIAVDNFSDEKESENIFMEYLDKSPQKNKIKLLRTTGKEALSQLSEPFDVIFIDADKESQIEVASIHIVSI